MSQQNNSRTSKSGRTATPKEMAFMQVVNEIGADQPADLGQVTTQFGDFVALSAILGSLGRKGYIQIEGNTVQLRKEGHTALANVKNVTAPKTLEERLGPRPEGLGDKPSKLELVLAKYRLAKSSLDFQKVDQRLHAWSRAAYDKVASADEKLSNASKKVRELLGDEDDFDILVEAYMKDGTILEINGIKPEATEEATDADEEEDDEEEETEDSDTE